MTYEEHETSTEGSRPVEVFRFTVGATFYRYTSSESEETLGVETFTPKAIKRSNAADGPESRDHDFQVTLPTSDPVAQIFAGVPTSDRIRLTVLRFQRSDTPTPETVTVFDGYVQTARFSEGGRVCQLTARTLLAALGRQIPARMQHASCNHVLYDPLTCRVDDTDAAFRAAARDVDSLVGNVLTVDGLGGYAAGWFVGGYVEDDDTGTKRLVIADDGAGNLTLLIPFASAPSTVSVFAGCDHSAATCASKFDNVINFGGYPFIPTRNPFATGIF